MSVSSWCFFLRKFLSNDQRLMNYFLKSNEALLRSRCANIFFEVDTTIIALNSTERKTKMLMQNLLRKNLKQCR